MFPYLVDLGWRTVPLLGRVHLAIPTYGVLVAAAILVAWTWYLRLTRADGIDPDAAAGVAFWGLLAGILGGKLGLVVVEAPRFLAHPRELVSLELLQSAGVVWTALLAGLAGFLLAARRRDLPAGRLVDAAATPLPVAQAIGRLGCLAAGCCFGGRCDLPWAIVYRSRVAAERTGVPLGVPLYPAPLYDAAGNVLLVLPLLLLVRSRRRVPGEVLLAWATGYGTLRFLVEFTRGDRVRGLWFGGLLSTSQVISLAVVPVAAGAWFLLRRRTGERSANETTPRPEERR